MRTLVDIPDRQIKDLMAICEIEKVSRKVDPCVKTIINRV